MKSRRTQRIELLAKSIFRYLSSGKATKKPENFSSIIVAPTGKLGDVVCCTPVLAAIRKHLPQTKIIVAGNSKLHRAILADSSLADEYLDLDNGGAVDRIREVKASAAIVTGPSYEYVANLYIAGVPLVVAPTVTGGFSPSETRPYKILKKFIQTYPYALYEYAPRERLRGLEPIGIVTEDTKKVLGFSQAAKITVENFLKSCGINPNDFVVAISATAGNKIKEWPEERFAAVADHVIEKHNAKVILIGGPNDREVIAEVKNAIRNKANVTEVTHFNIDELKALISKLNLFVAVDTGPIYIAEAFDVPTIDIVGPVDEHVQPPRGNIHRNVVPERKKAELFILNARSYDAVEAERQTKSITVKNVCSALDSLLSDLRKTRHVV